MALLGNASINCLVKQIDYSKSSLNMLTFYSNMVNSFLDSPIVTEPNRRVKCDSRCNFTIDSNPTAKFVSLENEGDNNTIICSVKCSFA